MTDVFDIDAPQWAAETEALRRMAAPRREERQPLIEDERAALARIMRQEIRAHRVRRGVQVFVRILAAGALLFFAGAFAWFVVPVVPISVFIFVGFGAGVALLFTVTGPAWPKRRRRTPTL